MRDAEVQQRGADRRQRDEQPRKIDLADQMCVAHQTVGGRRHGVREERPWKERRKREQRIREAIGGHLGPASEEQAEHAHRRQRLKNRPRSAQHGLLVADLDVAPDEKSQELAVLPELAPPDRDPAGARLDHEEWRRRFQGDRCAGHGAARGFFGGRIESERDTGPHHVARAMK